MTEEEIKKLITKDGHNLRGILWLISAAAVFLGVAGLITTSLVIGIAFVTGIYGLMAKDTTDEQKLKARIQRAEGRNNVS